MKYFTHEELHEIEEKLLDRKTTVKYLGDNKMKKIPWSYEAWEDALIECCAEDGCPIEAVEKFLHRTTGDVTHHIRERGYENWFAYCEVVQGVPKENLKKSRKVTYRNIVESAIGRPLTKEELVHHVNCDHYDDTLNNLWVCNRLNHKYAHASYRNLQRALISYGVISFDRKTGDYRFNQDAVSGFLQHWQNSNDNPQETADSEKEDE